MHTQKFVLRLLHLQHHTQVNRQQAVVENVKSHLTRSVLSILLFSNTSIKTSPQGRLCSPAHQIKSLSMYDVGFEPPTSTQGWIKKTGRVGEQGETGMVFRIKAEFTKQSFVEVKVESSMRRRLFNMSSLDGSMVKPHQ